MGVYTETDIVGVDDAVLPDICLYFAVRAVQVSLEGGSFSTMLEVIVSRISISRQLAKMPVRSSGEAFLPPWRASATATRISRVLDRSMVSALIVSG